MKGSTLLQTLTLIICIILAYYTYESTNEIKQLHTENETICNKLDSLRNITPVSADRHKSAAGKAAASSSIEFSSDRPKKITDTHKKEAGNAPTKNPYRSANKVSKAVTKISVSASYRIEDRYVLSKVTLPETTGKETGTVTVDILVDHIGNVKKTAIASTNGITNEDVLDACRKAALKTDFNVNTDAPKSQPGTITYTFIAQ